MFATGAGRAWKIRTFWTEVDSATGANWVYYKVRASICLPLKNLLH